MRAQGHELVTFGVEDSESMHPIDTQGFFGMLKTASVIKRENIDHVSVQFIMPFYRKKFMGLNFILFLWAMRKKRVIVTLHEVHRLRSWSQLLRKPADLAHIVIEGLIARLSSGVILLTDAQNTDLRHYGARRTRTVYLGILPKPFPRTRTQFDQALFFGKLLPTKGVHLFPGIARACPHVHFTIACSVEPNHAAYRDELVGAFEGIPNITFLCKDWIGDEEKDGYFAKADVLVLPYVDTYYQSGVAAESGVYNIPNVIPRLGPLSEITEKFRTGVAIDYPSPEAVRDAIQEIFADYPAYLEGIRRYRQEANWAEAARKYLNYLET
jgi:glycosyltransferase involved in cell wall biosynthesis